MRIFTNAAFISCDENDHIFSVMIEEKGRIVFTGDSIPEKYKGGTVVDLNGKCVLPAFADTHIHFGSFSLFHFGLNLSCAKNFDEMVAIIKKYEEQHPKDKFLFGFGVSAHTVEESRLVERADLDKMTSRPLLIEKYDGHAAVANSALIELFPPEVLNDPDFNESSGWLYVNSHYTSVQHVTKMMNPLNMVGSMIQGADFMARRGIGLIHSVEANGFPGDKDFDLMMKIGKALPQEFRLYMQTMEPKKVIKRKLTRIGGCFACALDGCFGSEDAALFEPYTHNSVNKGVLIYSQQEVNDFVREANRAGLQVSMHAIGDAAFEQALTAYEYALKDCPRADHRHIIIHADLSRPEQLERAARLKLHLAVQPNFLDWREEPMEYLEKILGKRAEMILPFKDMREAGLLLSAGSDGPCTIPDPILSIHNTCNHPNPSQSLPVYEALKMHTIWPAQFSFDEKDLGTLTPGKWANFTALSHNPLELPVSELRNISVEETYFRGQKYEGMSTSAMKLILRSLVSRGKI
ncbi:MAG: amidohydrolase [Bacillota bacterium]|nr:amidohydrolase [Bacillota bacterium]